jgi:hypothetical protein
MDIEHVNKAIVENYGKLRTRMGVLAFVFPVVVVAAGFRWGLGLQPTLSDYYFADKPVSGRIDLYPVRLWFCGVLAIVGFFLWKYAGFSKNEDRWLNAAGSFVLGVAIFPMLVDGKSDFNPFEWIGLSQLSPHGVSAVLAFVCIAIVIFWFSDETLLELKDADPAAYTWYKNIYRLIAGYMAFSITASVIMHYLNQKQGSWILIAEASGIWAFAAYWFVKNRELEEVKRILKGKKPIGLGGDAQEMDQVMDGADAISIP